MPLACSLNQVLKQPHAQVVNKAVPQQRYDKEQNARLSRISEVIQKTVASTESHEANMIIPSSKQLTSTTVISG